jgi:outer membrane lipoprotein SlyB
MKSPPAAPAYRAHMRDAASKSYLRDPPPTRASLTVIAWLSCAAVILFLVAGCAAYQPIIDNRGVDPARYQADLYECQQYAARVDPAANAAGTAIASAVMGAALGAIFGNRQAVGQGAAAFGLLGAASGGAQGAAAQREIVLRCLNGRGYRALY